MRFVGIGGGGREFVKTPRFFLFFKTRFHAKLTFWSHVYNCDEVVSDQWTLERVRFQGLGGRYSLLPKETLKIMTAMVWGGSQCSRPFFRLLNLNLVVDRWLFKFDNTTLSPDNKLGGLCQHLQGESWRVVQSLVLQVWTNQVQGPAEELNFEVGSCR